MLCRQENSVQIARFVILGADRRSRLRRVLMGVPSYQLTTNFSAKCQLTTNFS